MLITSRLQYRDLSFSYMTMPMTRAAISFPTGYKAVGVKDIGITINVLASHIEPSKYYN